MNQSFRILLALISLHGLLIAWPLKIVVADGYFPSWESTRPTRIIPIIFDKKSSDVQNGERLRKLVEQLKPGEQLEIGAGTYSIERMWDIMVSGTSTSPIWIVAAKDAKVVVTRPDAQQNVLNIGQGQSVQFLCIRGIEFTGGSHGLRLGKCAHVWIDQCHIHHTNEVCLSANTANTNHLYLTRNTIHDGNGHAEGMYLGGNYGEAMMSESVIALNHVYNCRGSQGDGIEVKQGSWGNLIAENHIHDCNYPCITVYGTAGKAQNIIERNTCYRSMDSVMQVQGEAIVRNNLLIDGKNAAFASTDHQGKTVNLQVIHNTLINKAHAFRGGSWNDRENMVLANNVIYSGEQNAMHFPNGWEGVTFAGNVVLGDGPKHDSRIGRGIHDFRQLTWDASERDATPTEEAPFAFGQESYRLPDDLNGKSRLKSPVISGAVAR